MITALTIASFTDSSFALRRCFHLRFEQHSVPETVKDTKDRF
jgi:hypothetical protein